LKTYCVIVIFILMSAIGCATTKIQTQKGQQMAVDPVCAYFSDMGCINVAVTENTPQSTYEGKTYYFCNQRCKTDFDKNPSKYLKLIKND